MHRGHVDRSRIHADLAHMDIASSHTGPGGGACRGERGHHPVSHGGYPALPHPDDHRSDERDEDHHVANGGLLIDNRGIEGIGHLERNPIGGQIQRR